MFISAPFFDNTTTKKESSIGQGFFFCHDNLLVEKPFKSQKKYHPAFVIPDPRELYIIICSPVQRHRNFAAMSQQFRSIGMLRDGTSSPLALRNQYGLITD
ncbi:MAG: hypothetical protein Q8M98_04675 [Candidatus Cloacimonadaceae bacterium]|nr:hypothetical protein [Candidatus Cloacimonadaceae bacterium]